MEIFEKKPGKKIDFFNWWYYNGAKV